MKYEDKRDTCQWCKKEMDSGVNGERAKAFCSDECRYKYHNAKRKIEKEADNALRAINFIQSMLLKDGELKERALALSRHIDVSARVLGFECKCRNCGQHRMYLPLKGDVCDFCQHEDWMFFQKKVYDLDSDIRR